jgi:hypothetical protein
VYHRPTTPVPRPGPRIRTPLDDGVDLQPGGGPTAAGVAGLLSNTAGRPNLSGAAKILFNNRAGRGWDAIPGGEGQPGPGEPSPPPVNFSESRPPTLRFECSIPFAVACLRHANVTTRCQGYRSAGVCKSARRVHSSVNRVRTPSDASTTSKRVSVHLRPFVASAAFLSVFPACVRGRARPGVLVAVLSLSWVRGPGVWPVLRRRGRGSGSGSVVRYCSPVMPGGWVSGCGRWVRVVGPAGG